ncbi:MAG: hypothetical protein IK115_10810 [Lachnospiraceae bacterium]|nr:hypothetical protein [Lachnospiraceae bacterium]
MEMNEFQKKVEKAMKEYAGEDRILNFTRVRKNNGILLTGVSCFAAGSNITPTVYLEEYLERYNEGETFGSVMRRIIQTLEQSSMQTGFDVDDFQLWENAKDRIAYKLINADKNRELLDEVPHIKLMDLALVFYYLLGEESFGHATILIYKSHMEHWGVSAEELYACAHSNTRRLLPEALQDMAELMREIFLEDVKRKLKEKGEEDGEELRCADMLADEMLKVAMDGREDIPMYVLSNRTRYFGAAALLYPGVLRDFAEQLGRDLYILPSSVHEVILLPDDGLEEPGRLNEMVREVNATQVPAEEILSDRVYYYDRRKDELRPVEQDVLADAL